MKKIRYRFAQGAAPEIAEREADGGETSVEDVPDLDTEPPEAEA